MCIYVCVCGGGGGGGGLKHHQKMSRDVTVLYDTVYCYCRDVDIIVNFLKDLVKVTGRCVKTGRTERHTDEDPWKVRAVQTVTGST